jgi:hypothetical protein
VAERYQADQSPLIIDASALTPITARRLTPESSAGKLKTDIRNRNLRGVFAWSEDSETVIRDFCADAALNTDVPPTFATWWPLSVTPQLDRFRITFQPARVEVRTPLQETQALAVELELLSGSLSLASDQARALFERAQSGARMCNSLFNEAQVRINLDPAEKWLERVHEAAAAAVGVTTQLKAVEALAANDVDRTSLHAVQDSYQKLSERLLTERPPIRNVGGHVDDASALRKRQASPFGNLSANALSPRIVAIAILLLCLLAIVAQLRGTRPPTPPSHSSIGAPGAVQPEPEQPKPPAASTAEHRRQLLNDANRTPN